MANLRLLADVARSADPADPADPGFVRAHRAFNAALVARMTGHGYTAYLDWCRLTVASSEAALDEGLRRCGVTS